MSKASVHDRIVAYLLCMPDVSSAQANYAARNGIKHFGEAGVRALGAVIKELGDALSDGRAFAYEVLLKAGRNGLLNECVRQGDVEGAVKAYYGRRSQKAQEEPRGPFPITDVQSLWLKGLLKPMPEPLAYDYWTLQRTA